MTSHYSPFTIGYAFCSYPTNMHGIPFTILLVDDDPDDRVLIDEAFQEIGYEASVKKFIDGKALLHYLGNIEPEVYPSLIVLDNSLPELEASDIITLLKENPAYKSIPVVIYTTGVSPSKKEKLLAQGAHACFEKGSNMQDLIRMATELKRLAQSQL